ncbi:hypothetical protein AM500_13130 [Bacillus sp. FJAT-18017]|uniref:hypothetical protein n=1 Tax=Bacillus sp. FJAT-18017 TaxID=1705566 RepID=UPI0006AF3F2B|nr:hypothetical protein [Bacillus sp. FJAT-18017]ALC90623.1 hypothetical protein AM500_13130 [Bacillus sp. FJAT-18017]
MKKPMITSAVCAVGLFGFASISPTYADEPAKVKKPVFQKVLSQQLFLVTYKDADGLLGQKVIDLEKLKWQAEDSTSSKTLLSTIKAEGLTVESLDSLLTLVESGTVTGGNGISSLLDKEIQSIQPTASKAPELKLPDDEDDNEDKDDPDKDEDKEDIDKDEDKDEVKNQPPANKGQIVSKMAKQHPHKGLGKQVKDL